MMDLGVVVQYHTDINQNCKLPSFLFDILGIHLYDFVRISYSCKSVIVQVTVGDPQYDCIEASDVACCTNYAENRVSSETIIDLLSAVTLEKIEVQIVLRSSRDLCNWKSAIQKEQSVSRILRPYGVVVNCSVKCRQDPGARLIGIDQINVLQTFIPSNQVGRVCKQTKIVISDVIPKEHFSQGTEFNEVCSRGLSNSLSLIKDTVESYSLLEKVNRRNNTFIGYNCKVNGVLLVGPSGCGKSSLAKKTAHDFDIHLEIIKCSKLVNLPPDDCKLFIESIAIKLISYAHSQCMILIEDIDCIDDSFIQEVLFSLLLKVRLHNVMVIGTATSATKLPRHLSVQRMFNNQIRIGVPGYGDKKSILSALLAQSDKKPAVDLSVVTKLTPGFVMADLSNAVLKVKRHKEEKKGILDRDQQAKMTDCMSTEDFRIVLHDIKPLILQNVTCDWSLKVRPIQWEDVGGMEKIKSVILKRINVSLMPQENLSKPWLPSTGGVLLYGPPGCCKTTLVRALATKWDATFFSADASQIYSPYVGDSEKSITQLFHQARLCAPAIIFLDELECLVGKRATSSVNRDIQEKVLSALLNEMDGMCISLDSMQGESKTMLMEGDKAPPLECVFERRSNSGIVVIGATNRPDFIDDALLRPGRFDRLQYMGPPNKKERESILKILLRKVPVLDVDLAWLAAETKYFSGADLQWLCVTAAKHAARRNASKIRMTRGDFEEALRKVLPSLSQDDIMIHKNFSETRSQEIRIV